MPEYLAPGILVEELRHGPRPIEGVSTSTAGMVGETERGPVAPNLVTSWLEFTHLYGTWVDSTDPNYPNKFLPYAVRGFFENGGRRLYVARATGSASATARTVLAGAPGPTVVRAIGPGAWGTNITVTKTKAGLAMAGTPTEYWFRIQAVYQSPHNQDVFEDFDNLSATPGEGNFALTVINNQSKLIVVEECNGVPSDTSTNLTGGSTIPAVTEDYVTRLDDLGRIFEISILGIPDEVVGGREAITRALVDHCETSRDRFAVVSAATHSPDAAQIDAPGDTSYAACYYPFVWVAAPHLPSGGLLVPPTGHIAGIIAAVDHLRGVHKAPANEMVRGLLPGPSGQPLEFALDNRHSEVLQIKRVNALRDFRNQGRGVRVWGARTMSTDAVWKYVPVRRLFIFLEKSIQAGTQWAIFETNQEPTWAAIRASINAFLLSLWRTGALVGAKPEQAFFVHCDASTMTQDDIESGRLICFVGIAAVKPSEFTIFRIMQDMSA